MSKQELIRGLETQLIHGGEPDPRISGAVTMPIFQSATFEYLEGEDDPTKGVRYIRYNNTPNQVAVGEKIAPLEGGEAALVTGSGMAAISATLMTYLSQGTHAIAIDMLYSGTRELMTRDLARFGIDTTLVDGNRPETWEDALCANTKLFYAETITNPQVCVPDLGAIVAFARRHGLVSVVDNTFTSPINFRAVEFGFDLAVQSASKYLNGHSDIVAGVVVGEADRVDAIRHTLNRLGGTLDPHAAFLLQRGLKTLSLRVRQHNENALAVSRYLESHPAVDTVSYPGLTSHPEHERAASLFAGCGGMIAFTLRDDRPETADAFLARLRLPLSGGSLGGTESLVTRPAATVCAGVPVAERRAVGIPDHLIRLSVGLESPEDLIADLDQALAGVAVEPAVA